MSTSGSRLSDSPWYWVYLFSTAGLIALVLMQPRFAARQAQIERKYQARQRAARQLVGQTPDTPLSSESQTTITLRPLYVILLLILAVAWIRLGLAYRRRRTASLDEVRE